ncbi:MlaC/ttg2D family ABC transporter substrate-binding protein [Sessilibacter corallicola]|uniref:ABC transporter substrate-binding protein n=1 Tax=Sessilibacter corallicola TaxID=2904075 RepID=A0ABQ0A3S6_9GAMM
MTRQNLGRLIISGLLAGSLMMSHQMVVAQEETKAAAEQKAEKSEAKVQEAKDGTKLVIKNSAAEVSAHEVVTQVTDVVLDLIREAQASPEYNSEKMADNLDNLLSQVVDFRFIAFNVMGRENATSVSRDEFKRFANVFKRNLVTTYTKGMASFADFKVEVIPPSADLAGQKSVVVRQRVEGPTGSSLVSYTMGINKKGEWVLRNMNLNGINLGKTFRDQFRVALKQNDGDVKKVIDNWDA